MGSESELIFAPEMKPLDLRLSSLGIDRLYGTPLYCLEFEINVILMPMIITPSLEYTDDFICILSLKWCSQGKVQYYNSKPRVHWWFHLHLAPQMMQSGEGRFWVFLILNWSTSDLVGTVSRDGPLFVLSCSHSLDHLYNHVSSG